MKKKILYIDCFIIILLLSACVTKKDRLTDNTTAILIDSSSTTIKVNGVQQFKAICRNPKSDNVDINPSWSVENNLGSFNPDKGKVTNFTAVKAGTGKVYATYSGVSGSIGIEVVSVSTQTHNLDYILLADNQISTDLDTGSGNGAFNYFDDNHQNNLSSVWQISTADVTPGCSVDPIKCTKVIYTNANPGLWGGFFLKFNSTQDLSIYTKLTFYLKGDAGGEIIKIGMDDANGVLAKVTISGITPSWQKFEIPFSSLNNIDPSKITNPFVIAFEDVLSKSNETVYIDYIGFEK